MRRPLRALAVALALGLMGCSPGASDSLLPTAATVTGRGHVDLVAFSTPQVAFDELLPAFTATAEGRGVAVDTSYGSSGEQSRAVAGGQHADLVVLSIEPDVTRLVTAGLVDPGWRQGPTHGVLAHGRVGFIVRAGNPKHLTTWDDLLRPGVSVLTPNPFTSGAAKWNLLAAYAAWSDGGQHPAAAVAKLTRLLHDHVPVQDKSGREALNTFSSGTGDVLLSYDYEAVTANRRGQHLQLVAPDVSVRIDLVAAVTRRAAPVARALLDFALSTAGQEVLARWGYTPVDPAAAQRAPAPAAGQTFTVDDLGGWPALDRSLFDPERGAVAAIQGSG